MRRLRSAWHSAMAMRAQLVSCEQPLTSRSVRPCRWRSSEAPMSDSCWQSRRSSSCMSFSLPSAPKPTSERHEQRPRRRWRSGTTSSSGRPPPPCRPVHSLTSRTSSRSQADSCPRSVRRLHPLRLRRRSSGILGSGAREELGSWQQPASDRRVREERWARGSSGCRLCPRPRQPSSRRACSARRSVRCMRDSSHSRRRPERSKYVRLPQRALASPEGFVLVRTCRASLPAASSRKERGSESR
mmetsp:Transcript_35078/g.99467  ORF Transcript_35078/g.99467 Transcript_35078/m.99467 type:complete len:243 (-) Transcript_35078:1353-2081(-)